MFVIKKAVIGIIVCLVVLGIIGYNLQLEINKYQELLRLWVAYTDLHQNIVKNTDEIGNIEYGAKLLRSFSLLKEDFVDIKIPARFNELNKIRFYAIRSCDSFMKLISIDLSYRYEMTPKTQESYLILQTEGTTSEAKVLEHFYRGIPFLHKEEFKKELSPISNKFKEWHPDFIRKNYSDEP